MSFTCLAGLIVHISIYLRSSREIFFVQGCNYRTENFKLVHTFPMYRVALSISSLHAQSMEIPAPKLDMTLSLIKFMRERFSSLSFAYFDTLLSRILWSCCLEVSSNPSYRQIY